MGLKKANIYWLGLLILAFKMPLAMAIVSGDRVPQSIDEDGLSHPGQVNTVALITTDLRPKVFCTGSIIAFNLILTAKHCVKSKDQSRIKIYFGSSQKDFQPSLVREVVNIQSFGHGNWMDYFPNGDVAWIQIKGEIPNADGKDPHLPRFQPLEILPDISYLSFPAEATIVGFGNRVASASVIEAGEKRKADVLVEEYLKNSHFHHLLLLQGRNGQGACHGDSGGPAYVKLWDSSIGGYKWYIIGVTNGFDVSLTPNSLRVTNDPDFPLYAHCDKGESIYSFAGAYMSWIEETASVDLPGDGGEMIGPAERPQNPREAGESFSSWCEDTSLDHPAWLTLKQLMLWSLQGVSGASSQKELFMNCDKASEIVNSFSSLSFGSDEVFGTLQPLVGLKKVRSVEFRSVDIESIDLASLAEMKQLEVIRLIDVGLRDVAQIQVLSQLPNLKVLDLSQNQISRIEALEHFDSLEEVSLYRNEISNLSGIYDWLSSPQLRKIELGSNHLKDIFLLAQAHQLEWLDLSNNPLAQLSGIHNLLKLRYLDLSYTQVDELSALSRLKHLHILKLKSLKISKGHFLAGLNELQQLEMSKCDLRDLDFIASMKNLRQLMVSECGVQDIQVFSKHSFVNLKELNLALNQIESMAPLLGLSLLEKLWLGGNPLWPVEGSLSTDQLIQCRSKAAPPLRKLCQ